VDAVVGAHCVFGDVVRDPDAHERAGERLLVDVQHPVASTATSSDSTSKVVRVAIQPWSAWRTVAAMRKMPAEVGVSLAVRASATPAWAPGPARASRVVASPTGSAADLDVLLRVFTSRL
jgi:hypothetical protein